MSIFFVRLLSGFFQLPNMFPQTSNAKNASQHLGKRKITNETYYIYGRCVTRWLKRFAWRNLHFAKPCTMQRSLWTVATFFLTLSTFNIGSALIKTPAYPGCHIMFAQSAVLPWRILDMKLNEALLSTFLLQRSQ